MSNQKLRIQFELTPKAARELEDLQKKADATTRAEVIRNALRLYAWFLDQKARGAEILVREGDKESIQPPLVGQR